jgi:branched-chain amino acid transport system substrate-binding protein
LTAAAIMAADVRAEKPGSPAIVDCNVPLTGALAFFGTAIRDGVEMAVAESSARSAVEFHWEDNRSSTAEAVTVLRKQLLEGPDIYLSGVKPQYLAIHDQLVETHLPHFVWVFDAHVRPHGENNYRTWVSFKIEPPLFIDYAKKVKPARIAIIYVQAPHTDEEYLGSIVPGLERAGFHDIKVDAYQMDKRDFLDIATRLSGWRPDLLILSGFPENYVPMIRALSQVKLIREGNTIASYDLADAAPLLPKSQVESIRVTTPSFLVSPDARVLAWMQRFRERYQREPLYTHAYAFDMAMIILDAAARRLTTHASLTWKDALQATDIPGITGRLRFDEEGDLMTRVELGVLRGGKLVKDR